MYNSNELINIYKTRNVILASFLLCKKICTLGKVSWEDDDKDYASIELLYKPNDREIFFDLIGIFAENKEVSINLSDYNNNHRFILKLAREKKI